MGAGDDLAAVGSYVDAGDGLVVPAQLIGEDEGVAGAGVELDIVLARDGDGLAVSGEGVVGDGAVKEVVDFGSGHLGELFVQ